MKQKKTGAKALRQEHASQSSITKEADTAAVEANLGKKQYGMKSER